MKKLFTFVMLAAMLLVSCVKEQKFVDEIGDQTSVHFTVAAGLATKAQSNFATGTGVDALAVQAFIKDGDGNYQKTNATVTIAEVPGSSPKEWDVDMKLAKNREYKIAFFAYKSAAAVYDVTNLNAVAVDYEKIAANSDDADAFCAGRYIQVSGAISETVVLYRPLAQINVGTNDLVEYKNSTLESMQDITIQVTADAVPNTLNVIGANPDDDGVVAATVSGEQTVAFERVDILDVEDELIEGYDYLSMAYVLANKEKETMTFTIDMDFGDEATAHDATSAEHICKIEVTNLPYQANYKTNIFGQLLTGNLHYDVEISPEFKTPDFDVEVVEGVAESVSDLNEQLEENKDVAVQEYEVNELDADEPEATTSTIVIPDNTESTTISFNVAEVAEGVNEIIIKDANPAVEETNFQNTVIIEVPASVDLDNVTVTVNAPNAHVILKQGDYSTVVASTSGNTLVVEAGATVDLLKVKAGNVKIEAGATVTSIVRETGNADARTLVIMEQGATWTNMADEKSDKLVVVTTREGFSFDGAAYHVENKTGLANFRDMVNGGEMPEGLTVELDTDLDMTGVEWTPIGVESYTNNFRGVFDGKGHTISNLSVTHVKTAGLFGTLCGNATIKNLKVKNVTLKSNHYAGGIVAWVEQGGAAIVVDNCSVDGGSIVSEPEKISGAYDNGDKVGGIVGFAYAGQYTNNSASNLTITAYRDLAGVAGYATKATITGNSVSNVIVNQSNKNAYKDAAITTFAEIVGRDGGENTLDNNTTANVTLLVDGYVKTAGETPVYAVSASIEGAVANAIKAIKAAGETNAVISLAADGEYVVPGALANGVTIEGNGATVTFPISNRTISNENVVLKNCVISNAEINNNTSHYAVIINAGNFTMSGCSFTGDALIKQGNGHRTGSEIQIIGKGGDIVIDNTTIDNFYVFKAICIYGTSKVKIKGCTLDAIYPFNCDGSQCDVVVEDCNLRGWTSYNSDYNGNGHGHSVKFTNCTFGRGQQGYEFLRPYNDTYFTNCTFEEGYEIGGIGPMDYFVTESTFKGSAFTVENHCFVKDGNNITYTIDGVDVTDSIVLPTE